MKIDVKDTSYCMRKGKGHTVPRSEMTKMYTETGKLIRLCVSCKAEALERRGKRKG